MSKMEPTRATTSRVVSAAFTFLLPTEIAAL